MLKVIFFTCMLAYVGRISAFSAGSCATSPILADFDATKVNIELKPKSINHFD
jgi:hypothetical protein